MAGYENLPHDRHTKDKKELAHALRSALAEADPPGWTSGCGSPHPTGGYHERLVIAGSARVVIRYRDDLERTHRDDGPAEITLYRDGGLAVALWMRHDKSHREDGPSSVFESDSQDPPCFYLDNVKLGIGAFDHGVTMAAREQPFELFAAMTAEGIAPTTAVSWIAVGHALGDHDGAADLRESGASGEACLEAVRAGVEDLQVIAAVGRGELPLSWASAGLPSPS